MVKIAATILLAAVACGALAAAPAETMLVPPPAAPKAEEKAPPYYSRSNPFAPLPGAVEPKDRTPGPPAEEPGPRPETPKTPSPAPPAPTDETATAATSVPKLNGILCSSRLTLAIVNDSLVKVDDHIGPWRITAITPQSVTAEREGTIYVMTPRRPAAQPLSATPAATSPAPQATGKNESQAGPKSDAAEKTPAKPAEKQPNEPKAEGDRKP